MNSIKSDGKAENLIQKARYIAKVTSKMEKQKLKELTRESNLDNNLGEVLLTEILCFNKNDLEIPKNVELMERVKILFGDIDFPFLAKV